MHRDSFFRSFSPTLQQKHPTQTGLTTSSTKLSLSGPLADFGPHRPCRTREHSNGSMSLGSISTQLKQITGYGPDSLIGLIVAVFRLLAKMLASILRSRPRSEIEETTRKLLCTIKGGPLLFVECYSRVKGCWDIRGGLSSLIPSSSRPVRERDREIHKGSGMTSFQYSVVCNVALAFVS